MDEFFYKMKDQAVKAKDEAAKLAHRMVDKTNNLMTQTKIGFAVSETEDKMKEIYMNMGEKVYKRYTEGTLLCECMRESCEKLDELKEELADLKAKLAEVKNSVKCEKCGESNPKDAHFCAKCGEALKNDDFTTDSYNEDEVEAVIIKPRKPDENE